MQIKPTRNWSLKESDITPESVWLNRRQILAGMGLGGIGATLGMSPFSSFAQTPGYPAERNPQFTLDRPITDEKEATSYINFYEFGSSKRVKNAAQRLKTDPWAITIDGMVEKEMTIDFPDLMRQLGGLEERLYRHRCVEAWAMAVPWTGVEMSKLVSFARPLSGARYLRFETFLDKEIAVGQRQRWYPWPYIEGVSIEEANNVLAFIATGIYGKPLPKQNGAPIRVVLPWKYGFKSIKSIKRITFTDERPVSFWEELQPKEYGFWANVNPEVPHLRWSQETERMLGSDERVETIKYNGYGEWVEELYASMEQDRKLFF